MAEQLPPELLASCDTNHGPMLLVLGWLFLGLAIITVFLRLYFRHFYRNGLHVDDLVMLASLIAGIIAVSWLNVLVNAGLGQHIYCLPPHQIPTAVQASILGQIFNILGIGLVKVSVCLTVLRIIDRGVSPMLKLFIWTLLVFACLSHSAQILLFIIQCRPMRAIWDISLVRQGRARCFSSHITYLAGYIGFGLDAFTDVACSAIPIVIVNRLHLNPRTKTALCVLMGLGSLTAACAIAKAATLHGVFADDYTYALTNPAICTILEHLCGMILASLPALRPLVRQLLEGVSSAKRVSSTPSNQRDDNHKDNIRNHNHYYSKHLANGAGAVAIAATAGGVYGQQQQKQQQQRPPTLTPSSHSNTNPNSPPPNPFPSPPQAPALAVSNPRSPRFAAAAVAARGGIGIGGNGGRGTSNKPPGRRRGSRTSWWAMPADRKSWRKSFVAAAPLWKNGAAGSGGGNIGMGMGMSHWHQNQRHQRGGKKSADDEGGAMGGSQDTDTTIVASPSSPDTSTTTSTSAVGAEMGEQFSALEKGAGVKRISSSSSFGQEGVEAVVGEETGIGRGRGRAEDATAAGGAGMGQITRTISFRVSSEHYSDGDVDVERGGQQTGGKGQGKGGKSHRDEEWPLNPFSPVDGVSPWYGYEDEEGPGRSPHEDYLRVRGWHREV